MRLLFSLRVVSVVLCGAALGAGAFAQKANTAPGDESRQPGPVRSVHSLGKDWSVPLCPSHFHDSLSGNGIASPQDKAVTAPTVRKSFPAAITQQAIAASGKSHIGNYIVIVNVVVDAEGVPSNLCLQKSSGYGLDAAAAAAVPEYRFNPAKKHGRPVKMRVPVEVRFANPEMGASETVRSGQPTE